MQPHEYTIIGHSRASIGRYLGVVASFIASGIYIIAGLSIEWLRQVGLLDGATGFIFWPVTAAAVFSLILWVFNSWMWKSAYLKKVLKIPDISGVWECAGQTKSSDGETTYEWSGIVYISQTWEKIKVRLKTEQSGSRSNTAALVMEDDHCCTLIYSYRNEPKVGEMLNSHVGFCELHFDQSLTHAEGDYFNNKGRVTYGHMCLTKKEEN